MTRAQLDNLKSEWQKQHSIREAAGDRTAAAAATAQSAAEERCAAAVAATAASQQQCSRLSEQLQVRFHDSLGSSNVGKVALFARPSHYSYRLNINHTWLSTLLKSDALSAKQVIRMCVARAGLQSKHAIAFPRPILSD